MTIPNIFCAVCGGIFPMGHICGQDVVVPLEQAVIPDLNDRPLSDDDLMMQLAKLGIDLEKDPERLKRIVDGAMARHKQRQEIKASIAQLAKGPLGDHVRAGMISGLVTDHEVAKMFTDALNDL